MVRIAVIGVGRIGSMHAELLARRVAGAALACVADAHAATARGGRRRSWACRRSASRTRSRGDADAVAICTSTDTHADLIVAAARAGKAIFCEKPVSLDLAEVDRALREVEAAGVPFQIGFNRRFDPAHQAVHDAVAGGDGRRAAARAHLQPRPRAAAARLRRGLRRDLPRHDDPRLRHGALRRRLGGRRGVRARRACGSTTASPTAGDVDTALVTLVHENGCLTAIDNSRQAVYGYDQRVEVFGSAGMAASENPLAHTAVVRTAEGTRLPTLPYFYLERYVPSYVREWEAFVGALAAGPHAAGRRRRRARAARDRARRVALAARAPAGRRGRGGGGVGVRVLLTGASGFVGSNLAAVFAARGAELRVPDARRARPDRPRRDAARRRGREPPDAIVHAAILNDPAAMAADRRAAWDAYVGATRNVVDAANAAGAHVVLVSTDWVFDGTQGPAAEDAPPNPVNQYGFLKAASELVVAERAERGTVARIAGVQGVHRARPRAPARAGLRLRLPRRVGRRGAARRASRSPSGRARRSTRSRRRRSRPTRAS